MLQDRIRSLLDTHRFKSGGDNDFSFLLMHDAWTFCNIATGFVANSAACPQN